MTTPMERLAEARKIDAKVRSLVSEQRQSMATLAYLLLDMRNRDLHRSLGESTISGYAVLRGVTRSRTHARDLVLVAERVQKWPTLKAAFDRGELDWTKLREALRALERGGSPEDEERWLQRVLVGTSRRIEEEAARACGEEPRVTQLFRHSPERQARLEHALQAARAKGSGRESDAEALARIVEEWLAGAGGSCPWDPTKLVVIHHCDRCRRTTTPGREGPVVVSQDSLEQDLCNAATVDIRDGPAPVRRTVPRKVARFVFARDGGACRVDGCNEAGFLHVHHDGGWRTIGHDPARMLLLCSRHHAALHAGLLQVRPMGGELRIRLADGSSAPVASREAVATVATPAPAPKGDPAARAG